MGRHAVQRSRTMISLLAAGSAAALVAGILSVNGSATADARTLSDNLVSNPDFESGNGGWNSQSDKAALSSAAGHNSRRAARLTAMAADANLLLNDSPNVVQAAKKDTTYVGSVWVRTDSPKLKVSLRFREVSGSTLVGRAQSDVVLSDGGWQQIEGEYVSAADGSQIAVQVFAIGAQKGTSRERRRRRRAQGAERRGAREPLAVTFGEREAGAVREPEPRAQQHPEAGPDADAEPGPHRGHAVRRQHVTATAPASRTPSRRRTPHYGGLEIVRVFHPSLPTAWPGKAGLSGGPVVVSFKANPKEVLTGSLDSFFQDWFTKAPKDRDIYWTNYHEPEDHIEDGAFTAAQYRDAFKRLDGIADSVGNPKLHTTTIWMCYDPPARSSA